jgi:hypothetical protein
VLLTALACGACAPVAVQPEPRSLAPTVTLPISMAGIADARPAFAALFDDELRARGGADAGQLSALKSACGERAASTSVLLVPGLSGDCLVPSPCPSATA